MNIRQDNLKSTVRPGVCIVCGAKAFYAYQGFASERMYFCKIKCFEWYISRVVKVDK